MHIHILGICGTFMGGIAAIAREAGHRVTGCDANVYPPMSDQLQALGIELIEGFGADQLALRPDVYVIGNVVSRGNPLLEALLDAGARYTSGPQWLAETVLHSRHVLAVAGTHGKTTTTSMLAWILDQCGLAPGFLIGGVAPGFGRSARLGSGRHFVIEADEYDTAFFDKRSKFLHYRPRTAILNNLEYDHADIFPDLAAIERQFHHLIRTLPPSGRILHNGNDANLTRTLGLGCWSERQSFGPGQDWRLSHDHQVLHGGQRHGALQLAMPGEHNRLNALAALAAAHHVGVEPAAALAALARFQGVKRRLELRGEVRGIKVYDDFAHHPTALAASIDALKRQLGPGERLLAIFEPRSNTMKLGAMRAALPDALRAADAVYAYGGGIDWDLDAALQPLAAHGVPVATHGEPEAFARRIVSDARPGDHLLLMSNGSFGGLHQRLLELLPTS